jgi:hypothetical protein
VEGKGLTMTKTEGVCEVVKGRRVTVDLTNAAAQELDRLRSVTGLTASDLFRHGLALARIYVDAQQRGTELRLVDPAKPDVVTRLELSVILPRQPQ